ncbi:hypothetical protein [Nostoc sp.]
MTKTLVVIANLPSSNYYVYFLISENAITPFYQHDRSMRQWCKQS